LSYWAS